MITQSQLTNYVHRTLGQELLHKAPMIDSVPNNVQIHGKQEVSKVVLGVSASPEFIEQAVAQEADYIIVHHGLHPGGIINGRFDIYEHRLRLIFTNDITLAGYHYALDAHPVLGNNAQIIQALGANRLEIPYFDSWGWVAEFDTPRDIKKLAEQCASLFEHDVFSVYAGPDEVRRIGVCSGGAVPGRRGIADLIDLDIDLHITGEILEHAPYTMEELGINYFACGHYNTETFGVKALAEKIHQEFGNKLVVEFIDIPTLL